MHARTVDVCDLVTDLQAVSGAGRPLVKFADLVGGKLGGIQNQNKHQKKAKHDIHHGARDHDQDSLPNGLFIEGIVVLRFGVFPFHGHVSTDGKQAKGVSNTRFFRFCQRQAGIYVNIYIILD